MAFGLNRGKEDACCTAGLIVCGTQPSSAVKYADLKNHRTTNYRFSYDDMLSQQVGKCTGAECNSSRQG